MTTNTMWDTLVNGSGDPLPNVRVDIDLIGPIAPPYLVTAETSVHDSVIVYTDDDGRWEADLLANEDITPSGTIYRARARVGGEPHDVYFHADDGGWVRAPGNGALPVEVLADPIIGPTGPQGIQGVPGFNYRGHWQPNTVYSAKDAVLYRGYLYWTSGALAAAETFDDTDWSRVSGQTNPPLLADSIVAFGHSYVDTGSVEASEFGRESFIGYLSRLLKIEPPNVFNYAQSGAMARWHAGQQALGLHNPGTSSAPRTAKAGVFLIWFGGNDPNSIGAYEDTWVEYTFKQGIKTAVAAALSASRYEVSHSSVEVVGDQDQLLWEDLGAKKGSGVGVSRSLVAGEKWVITTPSDMGRYWPGTWMTFHFHGARTGGKVQIKLDDNDPIDVDFGPGIASGTAFGQASDAIDFWVPCVARLYVPTEYEDTERHLTVKQHTIELINNGLVGSSSMGLMFDCYSIDADVSPMIPVLGMVDAPMGQYIWSPLSDRNDPDSWTNDECTVDAYNRWIREALEEFMDNSNEGPNKCVRFVDMNKFMGGGPDWELLSNDEWFNNDHLHPSKEGGKQAATGVYEELVAALDDGCTHANFMGKHPDQSDPVSRPARLFSVAGVPISLVDDFSRDPSRSAGGPLVDTVGVFGIDETNQLFVANSKFQDWDVYEDFVNDGDLNGSKVNFDNVEPAKRAWEVWRGTWSRLNGQAKCSAVAGGPYGLAALDLGSTEQAVECSWSLGGGAGVDSGIFLRGSSESDYLYFTVNAFAIGLLYKRVGGVSTSLGYVTLGTNVRIEVGDDDVVRFYSGASGAKATDTNGSIVSGEYTITDASLQHTNVNATYAGLWSNNAGGTMASAVWNFFEAGTSECPAGIRSHSGFNFKLDDLDGDDGAIAFKIGDDGTGLNTAVEYIGLAYRWQDSSNYYLLWIDFVFGVLALNKVVAGTATVIGYSWAPPATDKVYGVEFIGDQHVLYADGEELDTFTDATFLNGTKYGPACPYKQDRRAPFRWKDVRAGERMIADSPRPGDLLFNTATKRLFGDFQEDGTWPGPFDFNDEHDAADVSLSSEEFVATDVQSGLEELKASNDLKLPLSGGTVSGSLKVPSWSPGRPTASVNSLVLPGVSCSSQSTLALAAGRRYFLPIYILGSPVSVDQLVFEVTANVAASTARVGLASATENWDPSAILYDSGELATTANGVVTHALGAPVTLQPGPALIVFQPTHAITARVIRGNPINSPLITTLGASAFVTQVYRGSMSGALDTTAPNAVAASTFGINYMAFLRIADPTA